ncbi:hypothetical protein [Natranaerobius thermophilus]|uniref:hypothetical protein n=1 Tax=Natranaerobius thermophilus TaxID=375929 RepID=UPI0002EA8EB1|nr:hypothetical protein [Natranaerobius thermophilus]
MTRIPTAYLYYLFLVIFVVFITIAIVVRENKKALRADKIVGRGLPSYEFEAFTFVFVLLIFLYAVSSFISSYTEVYSLLIPEYFDHWYELFCFENIQTMEEYFREQDKSSERFKMSGYLRNLTFLLNVSFAFIGGIYSLYLGLQKPEFGENGIYGKNKTLDWEEIEDYHWKGPSVDTKGEKYNLVLTHTSVSKIQRLYTLEDKFICTIYSEDKEKIDELLQRKVSKSGV